MSDVATSPAGGDASVQHVSFPFHLLGVLPMCQQVELVFSTLQHDMNVTSAHANHLLFTLFLAHLSRVNHREVFLTDAQCAQFVSMLRSRRRDVDANPLPFAFNEDLDLNDVIASTLRRQSTDSLLSHCSSETEDSTSMQAGAKCISRWRGETLAWWVARFLRMPSGSRGRSSWNSRASSRRERSMVRNGPH